MKRLRSKNAAGFTVVELIVVIAVIGILAGIVIVSYGAWERNTREGTVKSDLTQAVSTLESSRNWGSGEQKGYPSELPPSFVASDTVTITGGGRPGGLTFCVTAKSKDDASIEFYVSDKQKNPTAGNCTPKIEKIIDTATVQVNQWGTVSTGTNRIGGLTVATDGTLYVVSAARQSLLKFNATSGVLASFSGSGTRGFVDGTAQQAQFRDMGNVVADGFGGFYQADGNNNRVRHIDADGSVTTTAQIHQAAGLAMDTHGNLFTTGADSSQCVASVKPGQRISKVTRAGDVTTYAGSGICGYVDGPAATAQFADPGTIAVAPDGTVYVQEWGSCTIRKISLSNNVSTVTGTRACVTTPVDGQGTAATFREIGGIATDNRGNLYISDHSRIRVMTPSGAVSTLVYNTDLNRPGNQMVTDTNGNLWGLGNLGGFLWKVTIP